MSPRLPALTALLGACAPHAHPSSGALDIDVVELTVARAQERMVAGAWTAEALTRAYLARIAAIDEQGPAINAVIALNPAAVHDAADLDAERASGHVRGPLHGVPVLFKDNIDVAGMVTSAGSLALAHNVASTDAPVVAALRAAGAVILGKTNLSEWANFRSARSISGWSSLGGQTRNPYVLDRSPCGSSAGTGAAIAASLALVGLGTETDGSIACPAAVNGLVGLKPTVGRLSQRGLVPISSAQDTAGPMARTVADAAVVWAALSGEAPAAAPATLAGLKIGVLRQATGYHPGLDASFEEALKALQAQGAELVDPVEIPTWGQWDEAELDALLYEFKDGLDRYLPTTRADVRSLNELIAWDRAHGAAVMPWFDQDLFEQAAARDLHDPGWAEARQKVSRLAGPEGLAVALQRCDLLVAPTAAPAWSVDPLSGDHVLGAGYGVAAVAGTPSLTVPMGEIHGLPVGITFMGAAGDEAHLLAVGARFEEATQARRPPGFLPTISP